MKLLLFILSIFIGWEKGSQELLDDQERYLKIALKFEPNDTLFLARNENFDTVRLINYVLSCV